MARFKRRTDVPDTGDKNTDDFIYNINNWFIIIVKFSKHSIHTTLYYISL